MYLGDPREQQICPDEHTIWEENNRVEKRYQWGAMVVDLCDLDPKEYAQTIFHTQDSTESGATKNAIIASFEGTSIKFSFSYPPASDLYVVISDSLGGKQVITIPSGSESPYSAELSGIDPGKITTMFIGLTEESAKSNTCDDGTYSYTITAQPLSDDNAMYVYMKHTIVESNLTEEEVVAAGVANADVNGKTAKFEYNIAPVAIAGFNSMSDEEYNEVMKREQLDLLVFTTSPLKEIFLNESDDQTSSWSKNYTTLSINGVQYKVSRYVDPEQVNIYDPLDETPRQVIFKYKITMS